MQMTYEPLSQTRKMKRIPWYRCPVDNSTLQELYVRSDLKGACCPGFGSYRIGSPFGDIHGSVLRTGAVDFVCRGAMAARYVWGVFPRCCPRTGTRHRL